MADSVSVIIITCNRFALLRSVLASLLPQLCARDEVVVVDTGSTDGTRSWLEHQAPPVHFDFFDDPQADFAAVRNHALSRVRNTLVAFLDDDCIPAADWLAQLRKALAAYDVVGGVVVPAYLYRYPRWWSGELAWATGNSPIGLIERRPDNYPATANVAAWRWVFERIPFRTVPVALSSEEKYHAGREDAEWWQEARRHGLRCYIEPRVLAYHAVPAERFLYHAVGKRVAADGVAAAKRSLGNEARKSIEQRDFVDTASDLLAHPLRALAVGLEALMTRLLWLRRQASFLRTSGTLSAGKELCRLSVEVAEQTGRKVAGETRLRLKRTMRPAFRVPDPPHHMLIAAPTYLGDTVLLLPVVELLNRNWPEANIVVWTRYPSLFSHHSPMITVIPVNNGTEHIVGRFALWASQVNFIPYYHFGSRKLWEQALSLRAVTFTHDVGFSKQSDYYLAAHRVEKHLDQHEILNLLALISLWPLAGPLFSSTLVPREEDWAQLTSQFPLLSESPYFTIQVDAGQEMKSWPLDNWEIVARRVARATNNVCCIIGGATASPAAEELSKRLHPLPAINLCGLPIEQLIALLRNATLVVGPDSGPKHLAFAVRTPTFTIYGPEPEHRWGAWFDRDLHAFVVFPPSYLTPREGAGLPKNYAMVAIAPEQVAEVVVQHFFTVNNRRCCT